MEQLASKQEAARQKRLALIEARLVKARAQVAAAKEAGLRRSNIKEGVAASEINVGIDTAANATAATEDAPRRSSVSELAKKFGGSIMNIFR